MNTATPPTLNHEIIGAIRATAAIPTMPLVATRFIEMTAGDNWEYDDLVELLSSDAGMVSEILRLANSALFGLSRKIASLRQSMVLLGLKKVRTLILSRYLIEQMDQLKCAPLDPGHYWRRSVTSGILAARLCRDSLPALREEAFVSGLLADVGVMILANALPQSYHTLARDYQPLHGATWLACEQHTLGISHVDISAMVLEEWQLPPLIVEAVRRHHQPVVPEDQSAEAQLGRRVQAATHLSYMLCTVPEVTRIGPTCRRLMADCALPLQLLVDALLDIETEIEDLSHLVRARVVPSQVYEIIRLQIASQLAATDTDSTPA